MSKPEPVPADERELRHAVRERADHLPEEELRIVHRIVQQLEVDRTVAALDAAIDAARAAGGLSGERIERALREHRARHPYGS